MDNSSDINYLIKIKKTLIDEIKLLENSSSNKDYFNSLPIHNSEVRDMIEIYNMTNENVCFTDIINRKRATLTAVNKSLKKNCRHRIIKGDFNVSFHENKPVNYCVLCMNFF